MNLEALKSKLESNLPGLEEIGDSKYCYVRYNGNEPFAVYYIDLGGSLPDSEKTLRNYQDDVIGKRYFKGNRRLQWNNYLIFVQDALSVNNSNNVKAKALIEADLKYARKFVIPENELDKFINPQPVFSDKSAITSPDVMGTWLKILNEAGIAKAILVKNSLPKRLELIEQEGDKETIEQSSRFGVVANGQRLSRLLLSEYRKYPLEREFSFGSVNLIVGKNAAGKTSLLEAIELFYCGRNKRNPKSNSSYKIIGGFEDGSVETTSRLRSPQVLRDRNIAWYGRAEVKTIDLYKSFSQFNFLNTDAAVSLSDSPADIDEDLSKLLVGPDASDVWQDINRVREGVIAKLREIEPFLASTKYDLSILESQLKSLSDTKSTYSISIERVENGLKEASWKCGSIDSDSALENLINTLVELASAGDQALSLGQADSQSSPNSLIRIIDAQLKKLLEAESVSVEAEKLSLRLQSALDKGGLYERALARLESLSNQLNSGIIYENEKLRDIINNINVCAHKISHINLPFPPIFDEKELDYLVQDIKVNLSREGGSLREIIDRQKVEYERFVSQRKESEILLQELRSTAERILNSSSSTDTCPLCQTQFEPGGLNIFGHTESDIDRASIELHKEISDQQISLTLLRQKYKAIEQISKFLEIDGQRSAGTTLGNAISIINELKCHLDELEVSKNETEKAIENLEKNGFSESKARAIEHELEALGYVLPRVEMETVQRLMSDVLSEKIAIVCEVDDVKDQLKKRTSDLEYMTGKSLGVGQVREYVKRGIQDARASRGTLERIVSLLNGFGCPTQIPLVEIQETANRLKRLAEEALQSFKLQAYNQQKLASESQKRSTLLRQVETRSARLVRFKTALKALNNIVGNHSLKKAMDSTLKYNRDAVESIFSSIHSPREFSGVGENFSTLKRINEGELAALSQVSTGQRAAFALSLFLAQNSQLKSAPPILLIDDPIAHIDDLNSLSFLDYLREIAISGKRQIFFATADDKLASLFEKKFGFLGDEKFKKITLVRNKEVG